FFYQHRAACHAQNDRESSGTQQHYPSTCTRTRLAGYRGRAFTGVRQTLIHTDTIKNFVDVETLLARVWGRGKTLSPGPRRGQAASLHPGKRCKTVLLGMLQNLGRLISGSPKAGLSVKE